MRVTILGCGPSGGVPQIGGKWGACDPDEPRNRRRRSSILVEEQGTRILVDTSPDLRQQLLDAAVSSVDAILWTHAHGDHLNGIDDVRGLNRAMNAPINVYGSTETLAHVERSFPHVFEPIGPDKPYWKPTLIPHRIGGPFEIGAVRVIPFVQDHGFGETFGFRFGRIAYSTDVVNLSDAAFDVLAGVDTWIVDAFCRPAHHTHSHLERTLAWIDRLKPRRAILTHMDIGMDYRTLVDSLPTHVRPAYDGMIVEI